jgi:hypothetical protein
MATINLGAIKFNWKGAYNNSTTYAVDDVVSSGGNSYVCIQASQGNAVGNATAYWNIMSSAGTNGTNGTDLTSTLTTQGDIVYRNASGLARLGYGTAGQVLQTGGSGADPSWGTISSDYVKLYDQALTGASAYTITNVFSSTYDSYEIQLQNYTVHSNGGSLYMRLVDAGGVKSGNEYYYAYNQVTQSGSGNSHGTSGAWGQNEWWISNSVTNAINGSYAWVQLGNVGVTDGRPRAVTNSAAWDGTSQMRHNVNALIYNTDVTATGLYFFTNGGNNHSMTVRIYGKK